eukprot:Skav226361  [mRNA]  locus=scaffold290:9058:10437:+ [translate_table: standard]
MPPLSRSGALGLGGLGVAVAAGWSYRKRWEAPTLVVGGGVMGLSTAAALGATGRNVILVDAAHPIRGSWGVTRASHFRMEDPTLLRMGLHSSKYWKALQEEYQAEAQRSPELKLEDAHFYHCTGSAMAGPKEQIENIAVCLKRELGDLPEAQHELLSATDVQTRFPQLNLDSNEYLIYMPIGFTMLVNNCIAALHWKASRSAKIVEDTVVHIDRARKEVRTEGGQCFSFSKLVITAGPWTNQVLSKAGLPGLPVIVSNEQTVELAPKAGAASYSWDVFPLFTWSEAGYKGRSKDGGCEYYYTTPHVHHPGVPSGGVKIGFHRQGALLNTEEFQVSSSGQASVDKLPHIRKEICTEQQFELDTFALQKVQDFVRKKMPGLNAEQHVSYMRCLYQCTPDLHMILGRHPSDSSVVLACGFSGSGFQFAPAIASVLSALVDDAVLTEQQQAILKKYDPARFEP